MNPFRFLLSGILFLTQSTFSQPKSIHIVVALCDNTSQGIIPVPAKIGNGQDPVNNLYWGCAYGVKTFFKKQPEWKFLKQATAPSPHILERLIFQHRDSSHFLIADAYDGAAIRRSISDFLEYSSGKNPIFLPLDSLQIPAGGNAQLLCYVGHNGLMDFSLGHTPEQSDSRKRKVVLLACASKNSFSDIIRKTGAFPLLWTTQLMCPEAYTLDAVIDSWIAHATPETIREKAAQTYRTFQRCGIKGARMIFTTGY